MNSRMPDHIDLNEERLARDLRAAARQIDLTPGSELAVVTRGRRRRQRQRRATTFTLVTALTAGTAVGVQQLSRTGDDSIASETPEATVPTEGTTPSSLQPPPPTTAPPVEMAMTGTDVPNGIPEVVPPAQLVASNMEWTVVEPDSTQAVAWATFTGGPVEVPGVILATAPGRSDEYEPMLWRTDDGITWEPVDVVVPVGRPDQAVVDGSSVYIVGTAPGVAETDPNPLVLATSVEGAAWDQVTLPVDIHAGRDLPLVAGVSAYGTAVPYDGGTFVLVQRSVNLDWEALGDIDERLTYGVFEFRPDGVMVLPEPGCAPVATTSIVGTVPGGSGQLIPLTDPYATVPPAPGCELEMVTWRDLGLPDETVAALEQPTTRAFRVENGAVTEVDVPADIFAAGPVDGEPAFSDPDGAFYRVDAAGELVATDTPGGAAAQFGWPVGEFDGVMFTSVQTGSNFGTQRDLVVTDGPDGVSWTDYTDLHGPDARPSPATSAITPSGLVRATVAYPDPVAAAGGVERSDGGLTVRRASMRTDPEFALTETGEPLALTDLRQDDGNGDIVAVDATGAEIARMSNAVASDVLYGMQTGQVPAGEWYIETSVDGRNVAVESIADLLGVEFDNADISTVPRISTDGTRTIVAVTMKERNADGVPRQLVLVGTPKV